MALGSVAVVGSEAVAVSVTVADSGERIGAGVVVDERRGRCCCCGRWHGRSISLPGFRTNVQRNEGLHHPTHQSM